MLALFSIACPSGEPAPAPASNEVAVEAAPSIEAAPPVEAAPPAIAEPAPIELHPVIRSRSRLQLFEIDDGTLFAVANVELVRLPATGPLTREPRFLTGLADPGFTLTMSWHTTALTGRWPDDLQMQVEIAHESNGDTDGDTDGWSEERGSYRFGADGWTQVEPGQPLVPKPAAPMVRTTDGREWKVEDTGGHATLVARNAGGTWREQPLPEVSFPRDAEPRAEYWAILGRYEGGAVEYVFEPEDPAEAVEAQPLAAVAVAAAGDALWVVAQARDDDNGDHWVLLHTSPRGDVLELPDPETMRREMVDRRPPQRFTGNEKCDVFVPLQVTSVQGDHQKLRNELAAVKMPREVIATMLLLEVEQDGAPALGIVLPNAAKTNRTILAGLRRKLGNRVGPPLCQDMIPRRELQRFPRVSDFEE
jgi:hypothetical protein